MKEYAIPCCGSCINFIETNYCDAIPYVFVCDINGVHLNVNDDCDNYKPRNPINNYEDELLEMLIERIKFNCEEYCQKTAPNSNVCKNCIVDSENIPFI